MEEGTALDTGQKIHNPLKSEELRITKETPRLVSVDGEVLCIIPIHDKKKISSLGRLRFWTSVSSDTSCLLLFYNLSVVIWIKFSIRDFCLLFACFVVYVTTLHINHGLFSGRNHLLIGFLLQYPHQVAIWTVPEHSEGPIGLLLLASELSL